MGWVAKYFYQSRNAQVAVELRDEQNFAKANRAFMELSTLLSIDRLTKVYWLPLDLTKCGSRCPMRSNIWHHYYIV